MSPTTSPFNFLALAKAIWPWRMDVAYHTLAQWGHLQLMMHVVTLQNNGEPLEAGIQIFA